MARALDTLLRLRKLEADQARRALGEAAARETAARHAADQARAARTLEQAAAAGDASDLVARAFADWLPASARMIEAADADCEREELAATAARTALAGRKAAFEAVESVVAERDVAARRRLARRAQLVLDELGQRLG